MAKLVRIIRQRGPDIRFSVRLLAACATILTLLWGTGGFVHASSPAGALASPTYQLRLRIDQGGATPGTVCLGDTVTFTVTAYLHASDPYGGQDIPDHPVAGYGAKVTATPSDSTLLQLKSKNPAVLSPANPDQGVRFAYKAMKHGGVEIHFESTLPAGLLSAEARKTLSPAALKALLTVKNTFVLDVLDCALKVSIVDNNEINAGDGRIISVGVVDKAVLIATDTEHKTYKTTVSQQVVVIEIVPPGSVSITVGSRPVEITAYRVENGFNVFYEQGDMNVTGTFSDEEHTVVSGIEFPKLKPVSYQVGNVSGTYRFLMDQGVFKLETTSTAEVVRP